MHLDYRINTLVDKIKSIITKDNYKKDSKWIDSFNKLNDKNKEKLIITIFESQSKAIVKSISNSESIQLPLLGSFKIKQGRKIAMDIKKDVRKEFGIEREDLLNVEDKDKFNEIVKFRIRNAFNNMRKRKYIINHRLNVNVLRDLKLTNNKI